MLRLFNTLGKRYETFHPVNKDQVTVFTCGPSVYQQSHLGNFRTFLFEDVLVRYLRFCGWGVVRGLNVTDVEDKVLNEARRRGVPFRELTKENIALFARDMAKLSMAQPEYMPLASHHVDDAVELVDELVRKDVAYWHRGNAYFDPLKYPGFGELFGLDMSRWPKQKRRFHKDTYSGMRWNLGDFVLWHGAAAAGEIYWDTRLGRGRPSWNVQDPSMILPFVDDTISVYCGGIDNLYRHHDYSRAIFESVRPYPMARYWLHCQHLLVGGQKMSKSRGNLMYVDDLRQEGYSMAEVRFFLIHGHYRHFLDLTSDNIEASCRRLRAARAAVARVQEVARGAGEPGGPTPPADSEEGPARRVLSGFRSGMNDDLNVELAFDRMQQALERELAADPTPAVAEAILLALERIDEVLQVLL